MSDLKKTVTVTVKVSGRIADLVYFAKRLNNRYGEKLKDLTDAELIEEAEDYWDSAHGED